MKKNIVSIVILSSIFMVGCGEKIDREQYIVSSDIKSYKVEYEFYNNSVVDSGYNWYNIYVGDLVRPIKDRDYKIEPDKVREQIRIVSNKIKEVQGIDVKKVQKAIDLVVKDQSKNNIKDKKYDDEMATSRKKVPSNVKEMVTILGDIQDALELGLDGVFDENDRSELEKIQKSIIEKYDNDLMVH